MDKTTLKLDKSDPGLYFIRVYKWLLPKNKLEKEISEYFRNTQHGALLPAHLLSEWVKTQKELVEWANKKHNRCKSVHLDYTEPMFMHDYRQVYTDFISVAIEPCKRLITEAKLEPEQSA